MSYQAMKALKKGNAKRRARKVLKDKVHDGTIPLAWVITENPELLRTTGHQNKPITIVDLLSWQPRWGEVKSERLCRKLRIPPGLELWRLSDSRRNLLARSLR